MYLPAIISTVAEFRAFQAGVEYAKDLDKTGLQATSASGRYGEAWEHFCEGFSFQRRSIAPA